jgi:hypothetical protein
MVYDERQSILEFIRNLELNSIGYFARKIP